jgi:hypothetical protein
MIFRRQHILRQHPKATSDAYRQHMVEIMNETGYFPVPRQPYGCLGANFTGARTQIQRWVIDSLGGYELGLGSTVRFPKKNSARHPYPAGRTPPPYYTRGI